MEHQPRSERSSLGKINSAVRAAAMASLIVIASPICAMSQTWQPSKTVEIVVGAGPGGGNDRIARNLQNILQQNKLVPATVIVLNKPGAGGAVGVNYLNDHTADGHYLMVQNPGLVSNPLVGVGKATYKDVTPIAQTLADYVVLVGKSDMKYADGKEVLSALKADPKGLTLGIAPGIGTGVHMAIAQVVQAAGIDPNSLHVIPFATASEAITGLLGGDIDLVPTTSQNVQELIKADRVKAFGVTAPERLPDEMNKIPTWREQGIDVVYNNWRAIVGPKDLPPEQTKYWEDVFQKLSATPEWKAVAEQDILVPDFHGSAEFAAFLKKDDADTTALLGKLGLLKK